MLPKTVSSPTQLARCQEGSDAFDRVRRFACSRYADTHRAQLRHFLPEQFVLHRGGRWLASCGLRRSADQRLFLELYLESPVEQALGALTGEAVTRDQVVEVGNLAGEAGSARLMILTLTRYLAINGTDYVVFTATRELRSAFARLNLSPWYLTEAYPERLGEHAAHWGHYYEHGPAVFAGSVTQGWESIQRQPLLMRLLDTIDTEVGDVV